ncbi:hypothetical protein ACTSKR_11595 [Chitinibacteraceae bacterium HSL-7]
MTTYHVPSATQLVVTLFAGLVVSGCAAQMAEINKSLEEVNAALASTGKQSSSSGGGVTAKPSQSQVQAFQSQLSRPLNGGVKVARDEARDTIIGLLGFQSCYPKNNVYDYVGQYFVSTVNVSVAVDSPMEYLSYHPRTKCLTIARIDNWIMPEKNALTFKALFVSDESGKSQLMGYEMVKEDGVWLFKKGTHGGY